MLWQYVDCVRLNTEEVRAKERVVIEQCLRIHVNGEYLASALISPAMVREFVVGHLFSQGIVGSVEQFESIKVEGNIAEVTLGKTGVTRNELSEVHSALVIQREDIFKGIQAVLSTELFKHTEAVHSVGLFGPGAIPICITEDVGRHNALDKAIGYALINKVDPGNTFVACTGRQPSEMVLRCCRANIPLAATKGATTTLAIDIANRQGLTIVGFVRDNAMTVYSTPHRISSDRSLDRVLDVSGQSGETVSYEAGGLAIEKELSISVNGKALAVASVSPGMEKEWVTGYLFGQGFIRSAEEIESITLTKGTVEVTLKDARDVSREARYCVATGGGRHAVREEAAIPKVDSQLRIRKDRIYDAMNILFQNAKNYDKTRGVHSCGLFAGQAAPICIAEDIGRHNTLDKVIGYGVINAVRFDDTFLVSTGRMASEMVSKVCRAGIPIVATKTASTSLGIEIARSRELTIVGFVADAGMSMYKDMEAKVAGKRGMKVYTAPERIIAS